MRWILFLPLLILLALFALSNMQEVELRLWPFDIGWAAPLGFAVLILSAIGFLLGAGLVWATGLPARRRARQMQQAAALLEAELAGYKAREEQARRDADLGRLPASQSPSLAAPRA